MQSSQVKSGDVIRFPIVVLPWRREWNERRGSWYYFRAINLPYWNLFLRLLQSRSTLHFSSSETWAAAKTLITYLRLEIFLSNSQQLTHTVNTRLSSWVTSRSLILFLHIYFPASSSINIKGRIILTVNPTSIQLFISQSLNYKVGL